MSDLPKRSKRFGVGKEIGGAVYVHRSYEHLLPERVQIAKSLLDDDFEFTVIKYDIRNENVSFIQCVEFDTEHEPALGDVVTVSESGKVTKRKASQDPWIYHHKWLSVADDYHGFDMEASKTRSRQWLALDDIDFRRIGKKSYWDDEVASRLTRPEDSSNRDS